MPASVDAVYRISFTALGNIGNFHFKSTVNGDAYTLAADAKIDTTIFDYRGNMSSNGAVPSRTPTPGRLQVQLQAEDVPQEEKAQGAQYRLQRWGRQQGHVHAAATSCRRRRFPSRPSS